MRALGILIIRPADVKAIYAELVKVSRQIDLTRKEIRAMGEREDAAYVALNATILSVKDGWAALVADRDRWRAAAEAADANAAAALAADSDADAGKVEAADAALAELVVVAEPVEG